MHTDSRPRPALFRALGHAEPPGRLDIEGNSYELTYLYKHDSWAATARYSSPAGDIVAKFNRIQPIFGIPMRWIGRRLARREAGFLRRLNGVRGIPPLCGTIYADGRRCDHAIAHTYIPGEPLGPHHDVDDHFFPTLRALLAVLHFHDMAYVDLHKRENILLGTDGRPYLIDFQVCLGVWSRRWRRTVLGTFVLRALQDADCYHLAKHVTRHRPDQWEVLASLNGGQRPWWINAHRFFGVPLRQFRRRLLTWLGIRQHGRAETESFPEEAIRQSRRAA